jgi:hypothetical protein
MWRYAEQHLGASHLVIAVGEKTADYYCDLFGFTRYTPLRSYRGFGSMEALDYDPVVGLVQDVAATRLFVETHWPEPDPERFNLKWLVPDHQRARFESSAVQLGVPNESPPLRLAEISELCSAKRGA